MITRSSERIFNPSRYTGSIYCRDTCCIIDTVLYSGICFEYIEITGHGDPYSLSITTSSLAHNNIRIITYDFFNENQTLSNVLKWRNPKVMMV